MLMPPTVTSALAKPSLPLGRKRQSASRPARRASLSSGRLASSPHRPIFFASASASRSGQQLAEQGVEMGARPRALRRQRPVGRPIGQEVDPDLLAVAPVRGDLQDRGAGKAAMGEQGRLAEGGLAGARDHLGRDAGQVAEQQVLAAQGQRHQRRPRLDHLQPEAARQIVGEAGRAHLRDGGAAGGDHQRRRARRLVAIADREQPVGVARPRAIALPSEIRTCALRAFLQQHMDDLPRRAVAEELAERLFVPGDAGGARPGR